MLHNDEMGQSPCLYCTRCAVSYCLWHLLSVKKHLVSVFVLERTERAGVIFGGEWEVGRYGLVYPTETLTSLDRCTLSRFWKRLCHVFIFTRNIWLPKRLFSDVQSEASPVLCCGISWGWWELFLRVLFLRSGLWYLPLWRRTLTSGEKCIHFNQEGDLLLKFFTTWGASIISLNHISRCNSSYAEQWKSASAVYIQTW